MQTTNLALLKRILLDFESPVKVDQTHHYMYAVVIP